MSKYLGVLIFYALVVSLPAFNPKSEEWVKFRLPKEKVHYVERDLGISIAHYEEGWAEAFLRPGEREKLEKAGFSLIKAGNLDSLRTLLREWSITTYEYHSYNDMKSDLEYLATTYPNLCQLDTIGYSVQGRQILALKISDNPNQRELEPEVRIVGCHHGNEWPSAEIPLYLAHYLLENYNFNNQIKNLVDNREIWIIPMLNPDGHEAQSRYNANWVDLNRDYGYMWEGDGGSPSPYSQPETEAMMLFSQKHNFVLSLSFHTYGNIVNYIWNYYPDPPPDSLLIEQLSEEYASYNGYWVTEGYQWYETHGDLNDYSEGIDSDLDWTIELGDEFAPPPSQLQSIWLDNRDAIVQFIRRAGQGIHGFVFDASTGDTLKNATVVVEEIGWPVFTDPVFGDYTRVLLPGTYTVTAYAPGYQPQTIQNVSVSNFSLTRVDFQLQRGGNLFAHKFIIADISDPYNYFSNQTITPWALGPSDNLFASLGKGGMVVIDFGQFIFDHSGYDLLVNEGDDGVTENAFIYVATNWNGPWHSLGTAHGTDSFDISSSGLDSLRYIKIVDDGDGSYSGSYPGYDLESIEATIETYTCGDVNSDGLITLGDVSYLGNYLFMGGPPPDPLMSADANGDCVITQGDIMYLAAYLFMGGPEPNCCPDRFSKARRKPF